MTLDYSFYGEWIVHQTQSWLMNGQRCWKYKGNFIGRKFNLQSSL